MDNKSWWLVLIQGAIALGLSLYMFFAPSSAARYIFLFTALYIFATGVMQTFGSTMGKLGSNTLLYRGISGLVIGGILLAMYFFNWGSPSLAFTLLAVGLIVYGAFGLWAYFFDRGTKAFEWGPVFINGALVLWGVMVFVARNRNFDLLNITAWLLLFVGAVAIGWSFYMRSRTAAGVASVP